MYGPKRTTAVKSNYRLIHIAWFYQNSQMFRLLLTHHQGTKKPWQNVYESIKTCY